MKILIFEWAAGTFTYEDIIDSFRKNGISYRTVSYQFDDKNEDDFFEYKFSKVLSEDKYDAVFSVNYFPLVAKCAHRSHIKYLSWSYDNPLDVIDIEKTLGYEENHVYLFDRIQVEGYRSKGYSNVYHLPLAANCERLERIKLNNREKELYKADVSFVGKMYDSMLELYKSNMNEYYKGYIDSIIKSQQMVYGYYMIDELLSDNVMKDINDYFKVLVPDTKFVLSREALSYAMGAQVTRNERLILLNLLASHFNVNYYGWEPCEILRNVKFMGSADYMIGMPKLFKASRINLNITLKILQSGIPLRVMDILGAGGFLVSNYQIEVAENFVDGVDLVMYESIEDAYDKVKYYITHEDERKQIAVNGHNKVKEMFSYDKQLEKIFAGAGIIC